MPKQMTDQANPVGSKHEGKLNRRQPPVMIANMLTPPASGSAKPKVKKGAR